MNVRWGSPVHSNSAWRGLRHEYKLTIPVLGCLPALYITALYCVWLDWYPLLLFVHQRSWIFLVGLISVSESNTLCPLSLKGQHCTCTQGLKDKHGFCFYTYLVFRASQILILRFKKSKILFFFENFENWISADFWSSPGFSGHFSGHFAALPRKSKSFVPLGPSLEGMGPRSALCFCLQRRMCSSVGFMWL